MKNSSEDGQEMAPLYNLKAVVMETGLKPPTIRAWERRYGVPHPQRTSGGHRQYSQNDIDMLKWLIGRQAEGLSISHAVELYKSLLARGEDPLLAEYRVEETAEFAQPPSFSGAELSELRQAWVAASLAFDRISAERSLASAFALFPPEVVSVELLQTGLSEIGALWYDGKITVQQEHFASAMSVQRMEMLIASAPPPLRPERIIVASAQDDYHVFAPLLLTYLLRRRGWDVIYLGADVPVAELEKTVARTKSKLLILSAQQFATAATLLDVTAVLARSNVTVGYGGKTFNLIPDLQAYIPAHFLGPTIEGAVEIIEGLLKNPRPVPLVNGRAAIYDEALRQYVQVRPLLESTIRNSLKTAEIPAEQFAELNTELAGVISAALKFGDIGLLKRDFSWIQYMMAGIRPSEALIRTYFSAYLQAMNAIDDGALRMIRDWLQALVNSSP